MLYNFFLIFYSTLITLIRHLRSLRVELIASLCMTLHYQNHSVIC